MPAGTASLNPNNPNDRSFSFDGIADGEYDLQATANGREGMTLASAPQRVSVRGADVTGLRLTLVPLASARARYASSRPPRRGAPRPKACKAVRATQLPQETLITASAAAPTRPKPGSIFSRLAVPQSATPDDAGAFTIRALDAGRYRLFVRLFDEALYVRSVQTPAPRSRNVRPRRSGGAAHDDDDTRAVSRDVFDVKAGQQVSGVSVRVAEGRGRPVGQRRRGRARRRCAHEPLPSFSQLRVHLVPQERERAEETLRYYEVPVSGDGTFAFKNLAPGRYLVVARPFIVEAGESAPAPRRLRHRSTRARCAARPKSADDDRRAPTLPAHERFCRPLPAEVRAVRRRENREAQLNSISCASLLVNFSYESPASEPPARQTVAREVPLEDFGALARGERALRPTRARPSSQRKAMQPPPPAPQTFAASAPLLERRLDQRLHVRRRDVGREPLAVGVGGAHDLGHARPVARRERRAHRAPQSRMLSKRSKTSGSPSMWLLNISQLLMPESRGSPV